MTFLQALREAWDPVAAIRQDLAQETETCETPQALLHRLQWQLQQNLGAPFPGQWRSLFKGHGMDLVNLREYQPGDEIRKIDWNVLARTGVPHIKEHYDERQVPVWFFVDATPSMYLGQAREKLAYAKELVGLLGLLAIQAGHRVGLILWTGEQTPRVYRPASGALQMPLLLGALEGLAEGAEVAGFPALPALLPNRSMVFLLSDFAFLSAMPSAKAIISRLTRKHQLEGLLLVDPLDVALPEGLGWLPVRRPDGEDGTVWLETRDAALRNQYEATSVARLALIEEALKHWGRVHRIQTDQPPVSVLRNLMRVA